MLTQDVIVAVRVLLNRVQLSGNEVPGFNKIVAQLAMCENELHKAAQSPSQSSPPLTVVPEDKVA